MYALDVNEHEVAAQAEKLRVAVELTHIRLDYPKRRVPITISIGGTIGFKHQYKGIQDLYMKADEALYKAKNSGRNKVCLSKKRKLSLES